MIVEHIEKYGLCSKDRKKRLFSKVGVVGCGKDGRNIVRVMASAGLDVTFVEISQEKIDSAIEKIGRDLDTKIESWGVTPGEKKTIMGRIKGSLEYASLEGCDFVIECVRYDDTTGERCTHLRKEVFKSLEEVLSPEAIIATNATTVIITELASGLAHKDRCVSIHFPIAHSDAKILEVVKGIYTSDEVYQRVLLFAKIIKYETIEVHESNGLVSLRLMVTMLNEACQMLMENVAEMEHIDRLFEVVYGMRLGVFRMADIIGIEKIVVLMEDMFNEYGDRKYKPSPLLWRLYRAEQLGISKNKGFYVYENGKPIGPNRFF